PKMEDVPPASMPQKPAEPARPRRWARRVGWTLLVLVLLLAGFHRPLIRTGARFIAIRYAASRNLALDFQIEGNLYDNIRIEKLSAKATGLSPVQELIADSVEIHYSLPDLIRTGKTEFVKSLAIRDVRLVLDPSKAS